MTLEDALKKIALLESVVREMDEKLATFKSKNIEALESEVNSYKELGTVEDVNDLIEAAENLKAELDQYKELGEISDIEEALDGMVDFTKEFKERLGDDIDQVESALKVSENLLTAYSELGTPDEVEDLISTAEDLNSQLKEYKDLLTVEEAYAVVESFESDLKELQVSRLQESYNVSESFAAEILEKWGNLEDAERVLSEVAGSLKRESGEEPAYGDAGYQRLPANESASTTTRKRIRNLLGL